MSLRPFFTDCGSYMFSFRVSFLYKSCVAVYTSGLPASRNYQLEMHADLRNITYESLYMLNASLEII